MRTTTLVISLALAVAGPLLPGAALARGRFLSMPSRGGFRTPAAFHAHDGLAGGYRTPGRFHARDSVADPQRFHHVPPAGFRTGGSMGG